MKHFWLLPKDQRRNNFVLFHEASNDRPVTLRERYADLRCRACKKFDEFAALRRGVEADVKINARSDVVSCDYGLIAASRRFREFLTDHGIAGAEFIDVPSDEKYAILIPETIVPLDEKLSGMEILRLCESCGRYRETCGFPDIASMPVPANVKTIFAPSQRLEHVHTADTTIITSQIVVAEMKSSKISGIDYLRA